MLTCFQKYEYISSRFITKSNDVAHVGNATYARACTQQHYYLFLLRNKIAYNLLFSYSGKCNVIDTACVPGTRFLFIFFFQQREEQISKDNDQGLRDEN